MVDELEVFMLQNIEAVIFDLDGTLIDSMWLWKAIDIAYLGRFGIELPETLQDEIEGMSFSETAAYFKERFNLIDSTQQIKADWNEMAGSYYREQVTLKNGVMELLEYLKAKDIKMGIATSNSKELVMQIIERFDIGHYFFTIRTSCEVEKGKPAPDVYLKVAEDLAVNPSSCLVFEDVMNGVKAGRNAGMKVCAVYDEFSKGIKDQLVELADYYIHDFKVIWP